LVPPASWSLPPVAATKIHWRAALAKSPGLEAIYLKLLRSAVNLAVSDQTLCCNHARIEDKRCRSPLPLGIAQVCNCCTEDLHPTQFAEAELREVKSADRGMPSSVAVELVGRTNSLTSKAYDMVAAQASMLTQSRSDQG
jgi:hypothetical protein